MHNEVAYVCAAIGKIYRLDGGKAATDIKEPQTCEVKVTHSFHEDCRYERKKHWSSEFFIKIWCHVQMKYTVWRLSKWTKWSEVQKRTTWWGVSRPFVAVTYFAARAHSHQPCSSPTLSSRMQIHWNNTPTTVSEYLQNQDSSGIWVLQLPAFCISPTLPRPQYINSCLYYVLWISRTKKFSLFCPHSQNSAVCAMYFVDFSQLFVQSMSFVDFRRFEQRLMAFYCWFWWQPHKEICWRQTSKFIPLFFINESMNEAPSQNTIQALSATSSLCFTFGIFQDKVKL